MRAPTLQFDPARRAGMVTLQGTELWKSLATLGRVLVSASRFEDGAQQVLVSLDRTLGARRSAIIGFDGERRLLDVEACHGMDPSDLRPRAGTGVIGRVAEVGQPIVVPRLRHDAMACSELSDPASWGERPWCLLCVPLVVGEHPIGALSAYFVREGHFDFAERLAVLEVAASLVAQARRYARLDLPDPPAREHRSEEGLSTAFEYSNMIGGSAAMRPVYEQIAQVARTNATALIRGESGTGKELVAHAIHNNSARSRAPFVKLNCAALPETLIESELFGHERGAFTGAQARKKGRFELAHGGTLFLDEIGELSPVTQAKLLRVLQFREFERLGGTETLSTDVRIVAATNRDIEAAVAAGSFREDLYYRVNVFTILVPPLRERRTDVPALAEYFLAKYAEQHGCRVRRISSAALEALSRYSWPGNVRELENAIERAVVIARGGVLDESHLPQAVRSEQQVPPQLQNFSLSQAVADLERRMIGEALQTTRGNCARAARALGTTERVVRYKAGKLGLDPTRFK